MQHMPFNPEGYERSIDTTLMYKRVTVAVFGYLSVKMAVRELCTGIHFRTVRLHSDRRLHKFDSVHTRREPVTYEQLMGTIHYIYNRYRRQIHF